MAIDPSFSQILLLLGCAVAVVLVFQKLRIPSILGYLLVGVLLGPHTVGPVVEAEPIQAIAEFGIVFLLFFIGRPPLAKRPFDLSCRPLHRLRLLCVGQRLPE